MANFKTMPPRAGMGRPKGSGNKNIKAIKDMVDQALSELGGKDYLKQQAKKNPVAFMGLVGKLIPKDLNISATVAIEQLSDEELDKRLGEKLLTVPKK